jgi:hypothetical protein
MRSVPTARSVLAGVLATVIAAGCSGPSGTSTAGASPAAGSPATVSTAAPTVFGPTPFADWTARQGFGGSSGLNNVKKLGAWLVEHAAEVQVFDLDSNSGDVVGLIGWLDAHPATPCWADYHAAIRGSLETVAAGYADARAALAAGKPLPLDVATAIRDETQTAYAMPEPASCP